MLEVHLQLPPQEPLLDVQPTISETPTLPGDTESVLAATKPNGLEHMLCV